MKRSLSWLELLWYLPLYISSVYFQLNSTIVLLIVAIGYTISHYHKYTSSQQYRDNYRKSFLFVHTKDTPETLTISCIWGILFSIACTIYFFLQETNAGWCGLTITAIPFILCLYIQAKRKAH